MSEEKVKIVIPKDNYVKAKAAGGGQSSHNGDVVASALQGRDIEQVYEIASEMVDVAADELKAKYAHLNIGQARMTLGNRIRGAISKMDKVAEKDETAIGGESYLSTIMESYPAPVVEEPKEEAPAEA